MNIVATTAAEGLPRRAFTVDDISRMMEVHTGPHGEEWASILERGLQDALITPSLPGLSLGLADIG